jgi:FMN phosphatase YigB (HAD superfamily)
MSAIRAVVLDVFGTIAMINDKRWTYARLMRLAGRQGLPCCGDFNVMTNDIGLLEAARLLGVELAPEVLAELECDLNSELASISLFSDVLPTLRALRHAGYKIALCSNLAAPYAEPVNRLLPFELDAYAWSFGVGATKPDPMMYETVCDALQCPPRHILMVGDTMDADYYGPRSFGMQARHLARAGNSPVHESISSLESILNILELR